MDSPQLDMFSRQIIPVVDKALPLDEQAREFFRMNGHVISAFVALAREYLARTKRDHVGAKMLWEKMRYEFSIRTNGDAAYRLNNNYVAYLARLVAATHDDLKDAFEFRRLRAVQSKKAA